MYSPAPCPTREQFAEFAPLIDICIPNRTEAIQLGGSDNLKIAAQNIRALGVKNVLITLGGEGCAILSEEGDFVTVPLIRKVEVIDTTGAGDSFSGALAYSLAQSKPLSSLKEHVQLASLVASVSVTSKGTQKSYPSTLDIVNLQS